MCSCAGTTLRVDRGQETRLPGFSDPAVVRTFDAPEALGIRFYEVHARSAINSVPKRSRMPFRFTINPYRGCTHACVYCFARPTHTYLDLNAREDFERQIVVKVNAPELVRAELARPRWKGEHVALGTNTDPYQWVEGRYKLMQGIWEAMRDFANPCSVLTKSPLLLRDLKLLQRDRRADGVRRQPLGPDAGREGVARDRAAHPASRASASRRSAELNRAGIPHRDPDRAADARDQRRPGAGRGDPRARRRGRGAAAWAASACTCAARCAGSGSTGCASTAPTWCRDTRSCTARGLLRADERERLAASRGAASGRAPSGASPPSGAATRLSP